MSIPSRDVRIRLQAQLDQRDREIALLREEQRIKDARMECLPAQRRPHYPPIERLAILELRAATGGSQAETARRFLVTPLTVASWARRLDDQGPDALVQVREPVNRFPDLVGYLVQRLKVLCPKMGTRRIASILARAGLHLGATTVRRMLKPDPKKKPESRRSSKPRSITAKSLGGHELPRASVSTNQELAGAPDHRPRPAVHGKRVRCLVPPPRNPAALRRHRQVRQPCCHRAIHPIAEERVHASPTCRALGARGVRTRARRLRRLVQRGAAALAIRCQNTRRNLLRDIPGVSAAAIRNEGSVAASIAVRRTARTCPRTTRRRGRAECRASRRPEASADHLAEARRLTRLQISRFLTRDLGEVCSRSAFHYENRPLRRTPTRPSCRSSASSLQRRSF